MKRYLKLASAALALIGLFLMFATQVSVKWGASGHTESIGLWALAGTHEFKYAGVIRTVGSGLAGYILLGVGALIMVAVALVPYFKDHDMLSMVVTGVAVICFIVGIILLFLIRKNFQDANGIADPSVVYVGWGAIAAGSLGGLAIASGALGMVLDLSGNN